MLRYYGWSGLCSRWNGVLGPHSKRRFVTQPSVGVPSVCGYACVKGKAGRIGWRSCSEEGFWSGEIDKRNGRKRLHTQRQKSGVSDFAFDTGSSAFLRTVSAIAVQEAANEPLQYFRARSYPDDLQKIAMQLDASPLRLPLHGISMAVKANLCCEGFEADCGSKILYGHKPARDSAAVARLRAAGAIFHGTTSMDEFGMGSAGVFVDSLNALPRNPWNTSHVCGGSSAGSAAVVAAGMVSAALGTDTGGSVRQPAAHCGVVGARLTYGRCSRRGLISYVSSMDTVGVFTRTVADAALLTQHLSGKDAYDSTVSSLSLPKVSVPEHETSLKGMVIGIPSEYHTEELDEEVLLEWEKSARLLQEAGATIVTVSLPNTKHALGAYYVLASAEASSNLARYDGLRYGDERRHKAKERSAKDAVARRQEIASILQEENLMPQHGSLSEEQLILRRRLEQEYAANMPLSSLSPLDQEVCSARMRGFGAEVQRRILMGTQVLSKELNSNYYRQAMKVRRLVSDDFSRVLKSVVPTPYALDENEVEMEAVQVDALLTPTVPRTAPTVSEVLSAENPALEYLSDVMTVPSALAGLPGISVPTGLGTRTGLPVGLQILTSRYNESSMFKVAQVLEKQCDFTPLSP